MFPLLEAIHVLCSSVVVGSVAMMDLRLLGVWQRNRPISELTATALPWTWSGFLLAAMAGGLLFASKAVTYYTDIPFRIKMVCMALAGINMLIFHFFTARTVENWDVGRPPPSARTAGAASLLLWIVIVAAGRWIGFTT